MNDLTACEAAARIRAGDLTSEALVGACLARIQAREHEVGAWEYLDGDRALARAREADRSPARRGALYGVPVGVKDIIDTVDMPTALGSKIYAGRRPSWDAACVAAARRAGAIILGKTVTTEFAYFNPGKTRNPHRLDHTPGGSSSGSAAAVADHMVPIAFGSQTAASVVRPASFCGVFGYKASFGDFSLSGIRPFAESLDTLGILARSIDDIALMRGVLSASAADTPPVASPASPKIGVCRTAQWPLAEPCMQAIIEASAERLRRAGAHVRDLELPQSFTCLIDAQKTIMAYEAARNYLFETTQFAELVSEPFRALTEAGWRTSRDTYRQAKRAVSDAMAVLARIFGDYDALLAPAATGEAPLATNGTGDPVMSRMWTALHVPCITVPAGVGPHGLPLGVQFVAAYSADDSLLRVAEWARRALAAR